MRNSIQKSGQIFARKSKKHLEKNFLERISHVKSVKLLIVEWALLVLLIISCAIIQAFWYKDAYSAPTFTSGGTYTEGTLGRVNSLNPLLASTNSEKTLAKLLYSSLTAPDYSGHTGNSLAERVSMSADGKRWFVYLRKDLKWSDGEPLTNADVLYTIDLIKNSQIQFGYSSNLAGVSVAEDGNGALVFSLSNTYVDFDSALNFPILPKHSFENENSFSDFDFSEAAFSGPFMLKATQSIGVDGEAMFYLRRNPNYYGFSPLLANFTVHAFLTREDILSAINSNSITGTAELEKTDADSIVSKNIYEQDTSINNAVYLFFNVTGANLKSRSTRRLIRQGINVDELRSVTDGDELPVDYPILKSQAALNNWPEIPAYDFEAAKTALEPVVAAQENPISIVTVTTGYFPALAKDLAEQLEALGFKTDVTTFDPTQDFIVNVINPRAYDILLYEIDLGADPDIFAYYHSSQSGSAGLNLSNYSNSFADDAILSARETVNEASRNEKYLDFLQYWVNDVPAIGLYQTDIAYYYNKNTRNFSADNVLVTPIDRFLDVEYWGTEKVTKNRTP